MTRRCDAQCGAERIIRKKRRVDFFTYLPDDILRSILILLPVELLRYKLKYVCKRWFNLISNQILFDQAALVIQKAPGIKAPNITRLVYFGQNDFSVTTKQECLDIPYGRYIRSWCNELLLATELRTPALYIFNLLTKKGSYLSPSSSFCEEHNACKCSLTIAFDKFKGIYKIVHLFVGPQSFQCEILVLEGELSSYHRLKWKQINGPGPHVGKRQYFWDNPVTVEGRYLHWDVHSTEYILSMDVMKVRFRKTHLPNAKDSITKRKSNAYFFVEMAGFLALLIPVSRNEVDLWILRDFQKTEWKRVRPVGCLSYEPSKTYPGRNIPTPVASLRNGSNIIFRKIGAEQGLYSYNMKLNRLAKVKIRMAGDERCVVLSTAMASA